GERICESEFFSARRETTAISGNLAKFRNAALENSGRKAAGHNLIRGSLTIFNNPERQTSVICP
ncbi:MAG TPA: hypothetical protein VFY78_03695, partial [Gammaproteobacteria bacterium]|nr:hypothetical protein [Gammaproteobacteria bacterium]